MSKLPGIEGIGRATCRCLTRTRRTIYVARYDRQHGRNAECQGHEITAKVSADGKFTMTNAATVFSKTYTARAGS